jgi:vacuolar-type H+-ATPase subunit F/Vma7
VSGFRPLGFGTFPVGHPADARDVWPGVLSAGYEAIFVTEPVYEALAVEIAQVADRPLPAVTVIPGVGSTGGVGGAKLERSIERALGTKMPVHVEE